MIKLTIKAFIKRFEAPQRSVKEKKIKLIFSSSGIETERVKNCKKT